MSGLIWKVTFYERNKLLTEDIQETLSGKTSLIREMSSQEGTTVVHLLYNL